MAPLSYPGFTPTNTTMSQRIADLPALPVPSYVVAKLPWAADTPNALVNITDNPQGLARSISVGSEWHWSSEVDGSDLGQGNASTA